MLYVKLKSIVLALAVCAPIAASAEPPLTIVVAAAPGGASDILARLLAQKMQPILDRTVVVENKPGANSIIGAAYVARAPADGSTLLLADKTTIALNPVLQPKLPYSASALKAVADLARIDFFFATRSDAPYGNWNQMVAFAKSHPGEVSVATTGVGSGSHISLELMGRQLGTSFINVPHKGMLPAVQAVMSGNADAVIAGPEVVAANLSSNRMKLLAVSSESRSKLAPDVPTMSELGYTDALILPTGFTLYAPEATPAQALEKLNLTVKRVLADPEIINRLDGYGLTPDFQTVSASNLRMREWNGKMARIVKELAIKLE